MASEHQLTAQLRHRIVSALHTSRLQAGERLPGVREVARTQGVNPRTVAKAYQTLQEEGLVEVRGRSGVYVAPQDRWGDDLLAETARWVAGVAVEGWVRDIALPDLPELVRKCTASVKLKAVCIAANEDHCSALCADLETSFGLSVTPIESQRLERTWRSKREPAGYPAALRQADLIVASTFASAPAHRAAEALGKPLVLAGMHAETAVAIAGHLRERELVLICADPRFGEQFRGAYGGPMPDRIRVVPASDTAAIEALEPNQPVVLTRAARERLPAADKLRMLVPHSPCISRESALELMELIIRLNMDRPQKRTRQ